MFLKAERIAFYTTAANYREVQRYIPVVGSKRRLAVADLYTALSLLPVTVSDEAFYREHLPRAKRIIHGWDPDDVDLVALALKLHCPVWSNDKDLEGLKVKCHTTLDHLRGM